MIAYKLFKVKDGNLYPLFIYQDEKIPINKWINAKVGNVTPDGKHVKSNSKLYALRPGWHSCNVPLADHIGTKQKDGTLAQSKDTVWCEIEISDNINYTDQAKQNGINKKGKAIPIKSCLKDIPSDGFYYFQTNNQAKAVWMISGSIKVNRILSHEEVINICRDYGLEAQKISLF